MIRFFLIFCTFLFLLSGCLVVNEDPNILSREPYNQVKYVAHPQDSHETIEIVQVTTRGRQANILNTIPQLYRKALKVSGKDNVEIGNITITSFTKLENYQVPYRECIRMPQNRCIGLKCRTVYQQYCTTEYRTETREVLYQKATADILTLVKEN